MPGMAASLSKGRMSLRLIGPTVFDIAKTALQRHRLLHCKHALPGKLQPTFSAIGHNIFVYSFNNLLLPKTNRKMKGQQETTKKLTIFA